MSVNGNGNVAALCEALELCKHELCEMCRRHNPGETCVNGCETIIRAKTALAANHQSAPVGNAAAMREALLKAIILLKVCDWPDDTPMQAVAEVIDEIEKASYAPPRNCDVGTFGEQYNRYAEFCEQHYREYSVGKCEKCPFAEPTCKLAWAQMPYEEGGAK